MRPQPTDPNAGTLGARATALVVVVLLGVAVWSWRGGARADAALPTAEALEAAAALVDADLRPGDGIAFLPSWAALERWRFDAVFRAHGLDLASAWVPSDPMDAWDVDGLARLWVVRAGALQRQEPALPGREQLRKQAGGGLEVRLLELPATDTVYDLRARLGDAEVARLGPRAGERQRCRWEGSRHVCDGAWWTDVFADVHEVGSTRRRCVFVQPHPSGATLQVRWATPPAARALELRYGNRLWAVRNDKGSEVAVRVRVGAAIRHELIVPRGDFSWHAARIELSGADHGAPIALEFSAADSAWRQGCFDARLVGRLPGAASPTGAP